MDFKPLIDHLGIQLSEYGLKLVAAVAVWIVGRAFIRFGLNLLVARLSAQKVDHTIAGYARNTISVALNIALAVVLMGVLGIETASFAAFIAGAGLAIGAAWSGLLSNFAAGAFLVVLRPFKAGDTVTAAGVTGVVGEVGLFVTAIVGLDNVRNYVGNSKVLGSILRNYDDTKARRIDLIGAAPRTYDVPELLGRITSTLKVTPGVLVDPAPEVQVIAFDATTMKIVVRPFAKPADYWPTLFAVTAALMPVVSALAPATGPGELEEEEFEAGEAAEEEEAES